DPPRLLAVARHGLAVRVWVNALSLHQHECVPPGLSTLPAHLVSPQAGPGRYNTPWKSPPPEPPVSAERTDILQQFSQKRAEMMAQLRRVIVGQREVLEQALAAIFTRGHCLLIGVPGLAKTLMVSSISQVLDVAFKRVQFTPDLMPSDITATMLLDRPHP